MNNINDILDNRDIIIESMSYFNPLILEEHNAIVTEGILGNIAETIRKLFDIIRGWISKLIDFVASKFSSKRKKNKKSSSDDKSKTKIDSKSNDKENNGSSDTEELAKQEKKQQDAIKNHPNSKKLDEILKDDGPVKSLKTFKLPTLKDAKKAIADIKRECETALKQKDPGNYASKDEQAIRKFFVVGSEKEISYDKLIHDKIYLSYTDEGGKICVDQLRAYKKALENEYTHLHNAAVKETNQEKAQALVKKAKGINVMTQKTMGIAIKCFLHYSDVVTKAMEQAKLMIEIGVM